jgi:hypothetical protein
MCKFRYFSFSKWNIVSTADKINGRLLTGRKNYFWPGTIEAPADSPSFINFRTANTFVTQRLVIYIIKTILPIRGFSNRNWNYDRL